MISTNSTAAPVACAAPLTLQQIRPLLLAAIAICAIVFHAGESAMATITTAGDISPAPPSAGGSVASPFRVGITGTGVLSMNGGTPLSVTGGSAIFGDGALGVGLVSLTGLGTDLSTADDLVIGNSGSSSVILSSLAKITLPDDLFLASAAGSNGSLNIADQGTLVAVVDDVTIGGAGVAVVQITAAGRMFADAAVLGNLASGDGRLSSSGQFSLARFSSSLTVGGSGKGLVEMVNQGRVESNSGIIGNSNIGLGTVSVSGSGSQWDVATTLNVGVSGFGYLNILSAGRVNVSGVTRLAQNAGSEAHVDVAGTLATWNISNSLTVGESGFSTLKIRLGGRVNCGSVLIADNTGSRGEVLVDGSDSIWDITGTLQVSAPGEAELTISNGGFVAVSGLTTVNVGGRLTLASGGRIDALGGLTNLGLVQGSGRVAATITNSAGGEIRTKTGDILITGGITNQGLIAIQGGELEARNTTTNDADIDARDAVLRFRNGLINRADAQLSITGGNVDVYGAVTNNINGQVVVGGRSLTAFHDTFTNNGNLLLTPGSELLTLENLTFGDGASLSLQLQGENPLSGTDPIDGFGQMQVSGAATLAGTLNVSLLAGFAPEAGDSFQFLLGQSVTGTFGSTNLPALSEGLKWNVQYAAGSVTLAVLSGLTGDYNGNGAVDAADYVLYRNTLGQTGSGLAADGNGNNQIDPGDLDVWRAHFGQTSGSGSSIQLEAVTVPEPGTMTLLLLTAIIWLERKRV